jgi:hypothetical protein
LCGLDKGLIERKNFESPVKCLYYLLTNIEI